MKKIASFAALALVSGSLLAQQAPAQPAQAEPIPEQAPVVQQEPAAKKPTARKAGKSAKQKASKKQDAQLDQLATQPEPQAAEAQQ